MSAKDQDDDYAGHLGIPDGYDVEGDDALLPHEEEEVDDNPYDPDFGGGFT